MINDWVTLAEAQAAIGHTQPLAPEHQAHLELLISAASEALDQKFGPAVQRDVGEVRNGTGTSSLWLDQYPVAYIILVGGSGAPANWLIERRFGQIVATDGNGQSSIFKSGVGNVTVYYRAGRFDSTETVGAKFKAACGEVLRHNWRNSPGMGADFAPRVDDVPLPSHLPLVIPRGALLWLEGEERGVRTW